MNRSRRLVFALALAGSLVPHPARASCIALSNFSDHLECNIIIVPPFTVGTMYVIARLFGDAAAAGCTGGEFRVDGMPPGWIAGAVANPAASAVGDPLAGGCQITFPTCQPGTGGQWSLLFYTITYFATDALGHDLQVIPRIPPADPQFDCVVLTLCDQPLTRYCVSGGLFHVNTNPGACELPVTPASWAGVKALFR